MLLLIPYQGFELPYSSNEEDTEADYNLPPSTSSSHVYFFCACSRAAQASCPPPELITPFIPTIPDQDRPTGMPAVGMHREATRQQEPVRHRCRSRSISHETQHPQCSRCQLERMQDFTPGLNTRSILGGISQTPRRWESPRCADSRAGTFTSSCKLVKSFLNQALGLDAAPAVHLKSSSSTSLL